MINEIKLFEELIFRGSKNVEQRTALTKVKSTKRGVKIFNKYYLHRPISLSIKDNIYTFNTSVDNLFVYFTRFGKEAYILEPNSLKKQMRKFHKQTYTLYSDYIEKDQDLFFQL